VFTAGGLLSAAVQRSATLALIAFAATITIAGVVAQNRDPIRVATRLVQVHVVVHDRDGRAVTDLSPQDFRLMEDGREQPIALFEVEGRPATTNPARQSTPPGLFTNRVDVSGGSSTASIILLDRLNTSTIDQLAVRNQALTFLSEIRAGDHIGLYLLDDSDSIRVLHDFTADADSLLRTLARFKARTSNELAAAEDVLDTSVVDAGFNPELLAWAQGVETDRRNEGIRDRARHTNVGLQTIARRLAGVGGRKNLIWISGAFLSYWAIKPESAHRWRRS
jgi:VWFA-related protein